MIQTSAAQVRPFASSSVRLAGARIAALLLVASALALGGCSSGGGATPAVGSAAATTPQEQLDFGVQMARRGLWSEALFRFRQAERYSPDNPRIANNIAVAYEALGEFDQALEQYQQALRADPANAELKRNYSRFVEFYRNFKPQGDAALEEAP